MMRTIILFLVIYLFTGCLLPVAAQTPTLEFVTNQGSPTGNGPTAANQVFTLQNNPDNPSGTTFASYTPTTTVTFSLDNQRYITGPTPGVIFGGGSTSTTPPANTPDRGALAQTMGSPTGSRATYFTSAQGVTGGIAAAENNALQFLVDANYITPATASTTYPYADLTLTFSQPVVNPVLHFVGIGARNGTVNYTTDFTLLTSGVTLSRLSGSREFQVTASQIIDNATTFSTTINSGAAAGSALVTTTAAGITSLKFRLDARIGTTGGATTQGGAGGDGFLVAVSLLTPAATPLPVTLVGFTAQPAGPAVLLQWNTASELHNRAFLIERSLDGRVFQTIGQVAGHGTTASGATYSFTDTRLSSSHTLYYRLNQVDEDGRTNYSPVRAVQVAAGPAALQVFPNPAVEALTLDLTSLPAGPQQLRLYNLQGQEIWHQVVAGGQQQELAVAALPRGVYYLAVYGESGTLHARFCKE